MRFFLPLLLAAALASGCASTSPLPATTSEGAAPEVTAADARLGDNLAPPHPPEVPPAASDRRARPAIPFDPNAVLEAAAKPGTFPVVIKEALDLIGMEGWTVSRPGGCDDGPPARALEELVERARTDLAVKNRQLCRAGVNQ